MHRRQEIPWESIEDFEKSTFMIKTIDSQIRKVWEVAQDLSSNYIALETS
jgi:hypothetical protein